MSNPCVVAVALAFVACLSNSSYAQTTITPRREWKLVGSEMRPEQSTSKIIVGGGPHSNDDPMILISRTVDGSFGASSHAFTDFSIIDSGYSYASYDIRATFTGTKDYASRHYAGYQSNGNYGASTNLAQWYSYTASWTHSGAGTVGSYYGARIAAPTISGAGAITNLYGVWVDALTSGTSNNYQLFAAGTTGKSYIGGALLVNHTTETPPARLVVKALTAGTRVISALNPSSQHIFDLWSDASGHAQLYLNDSAAASKVVLKAFGLSTIAGGGLAVAGGGIHAGGADDPGDNNLWVDGTVSVGLAAPAAGILVQATGNTTTSTSQYGMSLQPLVSADATSGYGLYTAVRTAASVALTNAYALYAATPVLGSGASVTNTYGLYIPTINVGTNRYAIYTTDGIVRLGGLPEYADNTAAVAGGLTAGMLYRTSVGDVMVVL